MYMLAGAMLPAATLVNLAMVARAVAAGSDRCNLRPGAPKAYGPFCAKMTTETACLVVNTTCQWGPPDILNCTGKSQHLSPLACATWQTECYTAWGGERWKSCSQHKLDPCACAPDGGGQVVCKGPDIVEVSLYDNGLKGSLGAGMSALTKLESLNLNGNRLNGAIPESWGSLTALKTVQMQGNALTGSIPASLTALKALVQLQLACNHLSGPVPGLPFRQFGGKRGFCDLGGPETSCGGSRSNQYTCPLPPGAAQNCSATCQ